MPKVKTRKSAAKRLRFNAKGRVKRARACASHLLSGKRPKRKRRLRKLTWVSSAEQKQVERLMPYA
ncbi:MAG: 50S ribosomal protein L35 [Candidatus Omnitrophota bacterium]